MTRSSWYITTSHRPEQQTHRTQMGVPWSGAGTPPQCANQGVHRRNPNGKRWSLGVPEPGCIPCLITAFPLWGMGAQNPPAGPVRRGQHCAEARGKGPQPGSQSSKYDGTWASRKATDLLQRGPGDHRRHERNDVCFQNVPQKHLSSINHFPKLRRTSGQLVHCRVPITHFLL